MFFSGSIPSPEGLKEAGFICIAEAGLDDGNAVVN